MSGEAERGGEQGTMVEEEKKRREEELEKEVWRCLNSVHDMLCYRQILNQTLRKGWMELASARYEMGPQRINQTLFSRKPQAAKAVVDVSLLQKADGEDKGDEGLSSGGPVVFDLIKDASERGQKRVLSADGPSSTRRKTTTSSLLRRRPLSTPSVQLEDKDNERDELLEYGHLIDDSDSEDDQRTLEIQKNCLQGFGAMVVPNLRSAQGSFVKALQVLVEVLNEQNNATDAHRKTRRLMGSSDSCSSE